MTTSRDRIVFFVNDTRHEVAGSQALMNLSDYLRYEISLTGTKVVCAEGDCGACSVLRGSVHELSSDRWIFKAINSCIMPVLAMDGCQLITVEGLKKKMALHAVQTAMIENFGSQCGFCTPGFVCALAGLVEDSILNNKAITEKRTKNFLTGNLCRCTGYDPIIKSALAIDLKETELLQNRYHDKKKIDDLKLLTKQDIEISSGELKVFLPATLKRALEIQKEWPTTKIVAGATDLGVAINKGRMQYQSVMSLQNIESLWDIKIEKEYLYIPARATLATVQKYFETKFPEMARMLNLFASPQIRNSGTLIGNLVNASPISDTIPFLMVSDALVEVQSVNGKRLIPIDEFFLGYKKLDIMPGEIVTGVRIPLLKTAQISKLYKVSVRKDLDISAVTMAVRFQLIGTKMEEARLAFGGVGPTVARLKKIESELIGKDLNKELLNAVAEEVALAVTPISDVRGSKEYRKLLCRNLVRKMADELEVTT